MMAQAFQTLIDRLHQAGDKRDLGEAMSGFLDSWGIERFAYLGFPPPGQGEPVWVTTYPQEWALHYERSNYQLIDPVVKAMQQGHMPFFWSDIQARRDPAPAELRLLGEASEFGINSGFTVPIHDGKGGVAAISLASAHKPKALMRAMRPHLSQIHIASLYFHVHARQKLESIVEFERPHLSPREIACLQWVALGKTMADISEILGISRRTVVFHLDNARRKLRAITLPQAVATALARRIIVI
jgi:LuxR family transcriptional regulator, activator of conjugal transfer of Ti plasmids